jgi:hypothetical protein
MIGGSLIFLQNDRFLNGWGALPYQRLAKEGLRFAESRKAALVEAAFLNTSAFSRGGR